MKKFVLGLLLGIRTTAAMASTWEIILREAKMPDGTRLGYISVVKEGMLVKIANASTVFTWDELDKAKAVAEATPE